ncbi:universal stress protein [Desulfonema magnum]|uniref:universal stress protein n=1 Tax=Desulfonema magnum TaxID=45655 RepID=UPI001A9AE055|nr:universal stress protein [Desulfonema magnum]
MKKKILLAVDDSVHSKQAVQYAVRMSSFVSELSYTLFNVQPAISQFLTDEAKTSLKAKFALEKTRKKRKENAEHLLADYKSQMIRMGIDEKRIETKTLSQKTGIAKDILEYAQEGLWDAIVVGRRGLSRAQEIFMGSLTSTLAEHSKLIPLWIIDGEISSEKIMIAIDGSQSSLRAVDHFSFIASQNPNIKATLLHVVPGLRDVCEIDIEDRDGDIEDIFVQGDKKCVDRFLVHAYQKFKEAGIRDDQIEIREIKALRNVGKAIAEEAEKEDYGTLIIGRRGNSKAFFMGSVSKYVLDKSADRAVWLVP